MKEPIMDLRGFLGTFVGLIGRGNVKLKFGPPLITDAMVVMPAPTDQAACLQVGYAIEGCAQIAHRDMQTGALGLQQDFYEAIEASRCLGVMAKTYRGVRRLSGEAFERVSQAMGAQSSGRSLEQSVLHLLQLGVRASVTQYAGVEAQYRVAQTGVATIEPHGRMFADLVEGICDALREDRIASSADSMRMAAMLAQQLMDLPTPPLPEPESSSRDTDESLEQDEQDGESDALPSAASDGADYEEIADRPDSGMQSHEQSAGSEQESALQEAADHGGQGQCQERPDPTANDESPSQQSASTAAGKEELSESDAQSEEQCGAADVQREGSSEEKPSQGATGSDGQQASQDACDQSETGQGHERHAGQEDGSGTSGAAQPAAEMRDRGQDALEQAPGGANDGSPEENEEGDSGQPASKHHQQAGGDSAHAEVEGAVSAPGDSGAFSAIGESTNSSVASDIGALNEKIDEVIGTSFARQLEKFLLSDWDGHDEAEQAGDLNLQQAGMISALLDDENVSLEDVMQALVDIQHASGVMKVNAERVKTPRSLPAQPARLVSAFMVGLQELKFRPSCEDVAGEDVIADKLWGLKYGDAYVFEDDGPRPGICASVEILLDASSSMETCIVEAATVVLNCALALERIAGVRCSVDKFPTSAGNVAVESLLAFGESPRRAQQKISSVIADGSTPMAEAIAQVRQSLMRDRGLKKVMIVVTDGVPDSKPMAQREVAICEALGILVIAIGIGDIESQINSVFKRVVIAESVRELEQGLRRVFKTHVRRHLMPA